MKTEIAPEVFEEMEELTEEVRNSVFSRAEIEEIKANSLAVLKAMLAMPRGKYLCDRMKALQNDLDLNPTEATFAELRDIQAETYLLSKQIGWQKRLN